MNKELIKERIIDFSVIIILFTVIALVLNHYNYL